MTQSRIRAGLPSGLTAPSTALVAQVPPLAALTEKRPRSPVAVLRLSTRRQPAGCKPVLPGVSALGWVHRRPEPDVELTPRSATWAIAALIALAPPRSPASGDWAARSWASRAELTMTSPPARPKTRAVTTSTPTTACPLSPGRRDIRLSTLLLES